MSKKLIWTIVAIVAVVAIAVVAVVFLKPKTEANVEGTLEEIMAKVYAEIPAENLPMLGQMPVDSESVEYYLGTKDVSFKEALVSEPMIGSIPHSVVLVRLNDAKDADNVVAKIKESANPRKWICVEATNVIVESKGKIVIKIMSHEKETPAEQHLAPKLEANFNNL